MDVVCAGILVADVVGRPVDKMPEKGRLELVPQMELHSGGCAANTGISLAKLGISTGVMGKVGEDGFGDFLIKRMQEFGLDTRGVKRDKLANTSATMVMVNTDGERTFLHYLGANTNFKEEDIDFDLLKGVKILHIAGSFLLPGLDGIPTSQILKKAKNAGLITSLDTAWDARNRWLGLIEPVFPYLDLFLPSIEEAKMICEKEDPEQISAFFLERGVKAVLLKMGDKGLYARKEKEKYLIPSHKITPVDGTGAGDACVAGFLVGMVKKWDLKKCAEFANAVGALSTTRMGATDGVKSFEETLDFIKTSAKFSASTCRDEFYW